MSEIISPPQTEAEMQQQLQQMQAQNQQYQQLIAGLQAETQKLYQEKNGKVVDNQFMLQKAKLDNDTKVLIAEIETKAQSLSERQQMYLEVWKEVHGAAHDAATQAVDHSHEADQSQQAIQAQQQAAQQESQNGNGAQG